jgi:hypothetical protein
MSIFAKNFLKVLKEQDAPMNDMERDAMESSLDDGTDASEFDVNMESDPTVGPENDVAMAMAKQNQQIVSTIEGWTNQVQQFLEFLNGPNPDSIQSTLAQAVPETVMDKMKQSQQQKIARVASDLASFHQSLLGFMAQTKNVKFKGV